MLFRLVEQRCNNITRKRCCAALGCGDIDLAHDGFKNALVGDGQHVTYEIFEPVIHYAMKALRQAPRNAHRGLEHILFCNRLAPLLGEPKE